MEMKKVPTLRGEELYIPFVGAIIEREIKGKKQILIQTREKRTDNKYSGSLEVPGGKMRAFEDVYLTLKREVKEECGLKITSIRGENKRIDHENKEDESSLIFPFCTTQMKQGPFIGMIFICSAEGDLIESSEETRDIRWMSIDELKNIVDNNPGRIYTAFLAPLKEYLNGKKYGEGEL